MAMNENFPTSSAIQGLDVPRNSSAGGTSTNEIISQNRLHLDPTKIDYLDYRNISEEYDNFYKFRMPVHEGVVNGYNYIFMTAPELALSNGNTDAAIIEHNRKMLGLNTDRVYSQNIINSLSGSRNFIPLITNRAIKYTAAAEQLSTMDYGETWMRYKMLVGSSTKDSIISGSFAVEYNEDSNLNILKMHKLWVDYIDGCFNGNILSKNAAVNTGLFSGVNLLNSFQIDYLVSIYHFAVKPDGETLYYWTKYTGVMPTSVPWDIFTSDDGVQDVIRSVPIEYIFAYKEDMKYSILSEFNRTQAGVDLQVSPKYHEYAEIGSLYNPGLFVPRIEVSNMKATKDENMPVYKLIIPGNS